MEKNKLPLLQKYKLFIFDWDGTLVDSLGAYKLWDKLYVQKFYGVDLPVEYFQDLANDLKTVTVGNAENPYFRFLDNKYGDGQTPMAKIWENVYSLASEVQSNMVYKKGAPEALKLLRTKTNAPITLATNAVMKDIQYFSSQASLTAQHLSPIDFFDDVVTSDHVENPKPHPETFQKLIDRYGVEPHEVLIFEDSLNGVTAAKATNADVVAVFANDEVKKHADYVIDNWGEMITLLSQDVA